MVVWVVVVLAPEPSHQPKKLKKKKIYPKKSKHKRGSGQKVVKSVPIFSANGAGCISKIQSIVNNVNHLGAGIITLQETHFKKKGKLREKTWKF